ncbi:hypothetical protein D3C85_680730 [compost metagenome]
MLLRMLSFISQGLWPRCATRPLRWMLPSKSLSKPATRCSRQLLPAPVAPVIPTSSPGCMLSLTSCSTGFCWCRAVTSSSTRLPTGRLGSPRSRCCSGLLRNSHSRLKPVLKLIRVRMR